MKALTTILVFFTIFSCCGQSDDYIGKGDYPEVGLNLTVPSGAFGRYGTSPFSQQAGMASNGLEVFVGYQIRFKKVPIGWYLSLSYAQMENGRLNHGGGRITKNAHYIFVNFLNGLTFQTNTGNFDLYARALISPAFIGSSSSKSTDINGREVKNSMAPVVGFGRGGEMGFLIFNRFRMGISWITYGYVSVVGDGSARRPMAYWRAGLAYTWKKN